MIWREYWYRGVKASVESDIRRAEIAVIRNPSDENVDSLTRLYLRSGDAFNRFKSFMVTNKITEYPHSMWRGSLDRLGIQHPLSRLNKVSPP